MTAIQLNKYMILSAKITTHVNSHYWANFPTHQPHLLLLLIIARMTLNYYAVRGDLDWPPTYFPRCYPWFLQKINQSTNGPTVTSKTVAMPNPKMCAAITCGNYA